MKNIKNISKLVFANYNKKCYLPITLNINLKNKLYFNNNIINNSFINFSTTNLRSVSEEISKLNKENYTQNITINNISKNNAIDKKSNLEINTNGILCLIE